MFRRFSITLILLVSITLSLQALELTGLLHSGNLSFDKTAKTTQSSISGSSFFYGASLYATQKINDALSLDAGLVYDPVLRYTTITRFQYNQDYITLGVGPFFGTFNTTGKILQPGISTEVKAQLPGILYASLRSDSTIGARFSEDGDYSQEYSAISLGYYIPNAICSFNLITKEFAVRKSSTLEITDSFKEYSFKVDIFQKNVPYGVLLNFAYQQLTRNYADTSASSSTENVLNSIVLGTKFTFRATDALTLLAELESSVYSFGSEEDEDLTLPDGLPEAYLFRAALGATWSF